MPSFLLLHPPFLYIMWHHKIKCAISRWVKKNVCILYLIYYSRIGKYGMEKKKRNVIFSLLSKSAVSSLYFICNHNNWIYMRFVWIFSLIKVYHPIEWVVTCQLVAQHVLDSICFPYLPVDTHSILPKKCIIIVNKNFKTIVSSTFE